MDGGIGGRQRGPPDKRTTNRPKTDLANETKTKQTMAKGVSTVISVITIIVITTIFTSINVTTIIVTITIIATGVRAAVYIWVISPRSPALGRWERPPRASHHAWRVKGT